MNDPKGTGEVIIPLRIVREGADTPSYATELAAGVDLTASIPEPLLLLPGKRILVPTGIALAIPPAYEGQVRPRSGLALHHGITVLNAPGTIDADYRGEIGVILVNLGEEPYTIMPGERIAQLVIAPVVRCTFVHIPELPPSTRGEGGFGHSGRI
ncbi:MAG: dUTP diphosphatase [Desulfuromonadia bacterium]